jgi:hypothetical protein
MPVPNDLHPQPVDRKAALAAGAVLETPAEAQARYAGGGAAPTHYRATPPAADGPKGPNMKPTVYGGGEERKKAPGA